MSRILTDLRESSGNSKLATFQPVSPLTATNVEDAINQVQANVAVAASQPPSITPTLVNHASSPYQVLATDFLLLVDSSGGTVTILLQASAARNGKELDIKDSGNDASVNAISLTPVAGEDVDGFTNAAPYPLDASFNAIRLRPRTLGYSAT